MPKSIKVGPHTYTVLRKQASAFDEAIGFCDNNSLQIWIKKRLRKSKAQEILLHEVLHTVTLQCLDGVKELGDESFVTATAPVLLQVIQDNPDLLEYLTQ